VELNRLHPSPGTVVAEHLFDDVDFAAMAPPGRPYVVINMVASADGRAALGGRTKELSSGADRAVFHALRASVQAVMVGTGTVREEQYGRIVPKPENQERRRARGLDPEPLALVVSRSGRFPEDAPLMTDPGARVLRCTSGSPGEVLRRAREEHGVRSVLCEGGPTLNAAMLAEGVFDELFLTIAPVLVGGEDPLTIIAGGDGPTPLELTWVLEEGGTLFLRYARAG
jgi:5-amino-6-(5-phosphoribosylamino)uracil reductase